MDTAAFMAEINKIPPVTRFLAGSSLVVTLSVMLQLVSIYKIFYAWSLVYGRLEIWRIFTSFFFGGTGINFLFDFIMLYRTSDALETQHYTGRSADYAWQLLLVALGLLGLNHPLGSHLHHRPLLITLVYLSSRLSPNTPFSLFGLVTVPALWWPYVLVGLDGAMGGMAALSQSLTGLVVGHAWWLLFWRDTGAQRSSWGRAPNWLKSLFPTPRVPAGATGPQPQPRGFSAPRGGVPAGESPTGGYRWGTGQRLGDS